MSSIPSSEGPFVLKSSFVPAGDQPQAIERLARGLAQGLTHQTLLGATGTGKTFTIANIIAQHGKPALVIAHNKTLAAQLAAEYRAFFPENAVHYFVSYYDYYQPEAYLPVTDTYIEKEAQINEEIDRLRHGATEALLTRRDVIVVASVSCIYGLGRPEEYEKSHVHVAQGDKMSRNDFLRRLIAVHYERTNADLTPGVVRAVGNTIEVMPASERVIYRIELSRESVERIAAIDPISSRIREELSHVFIFPAKHFVTPEGERERAIRDITKELAERLAYFERAGKPLEYERLKRRTNYDLAMIREVGYCNGIENYSRHFDGRETGEPPATLLSYFPRTHDGTPDFLTVIDESHVTIPQLSGMYHGDRARKEILVEHGFRLPSAKDNRPLTFDEFDENIGPRIYTSATPGTYEGELSVPPAGALVEQIIRPTGLVDPEVIVRPVRATSMTKQVQPVSSELVQSGLASGIPTSLAYPGQVQDFIASAEEVIQQGHRAIATTLTKKMAEDLSEFLKKRGVKAEYLHSDIKTIERIRILTDFRKGVFDVLVGVNLLREGLDLPEVSFIGILDADKEGFLRSDIALIQIIGRAARNAEGRVVLYADSVTGSMRRAIDETNRRRAIQEEYNKKHGITPATIVKNITDITDQLRSEHEKAVDTLISLDEALYRENPRKLIKEKEKQMSAAVKELDFETAAILRDEIKALEKFQK